jgi:CheY-like chemotaxis protein
VIEARDGLEALGPLRGAADAASLAKPNLVVIDLNMPPMNGLEFLAEPRRAPGLAPSIVFVFTTSEADRDVSEAYSLNVARYIIRSRATGDLRDPADLLAAELSEAATCGEGLRQFAAEIFDESGRRSCAFRACRRTAHHLR